MKNPEYLYVFVRKDIPVVNQIVQVGHACYEAGGRFFEFGETNPLILLEVENESDLLNACVEISHAGIDFFLFFEPDFPKGFMAACTEPVKSVQRPLFAGYRLWAEGGRSGASSG